VRVRASVVADGLAELQVAFPTVPVMFCENRALAQQWTYRFLAAASAAQELDLYGASTVAGLAEAQPLPPREPTTAELREWARANGYDVSDRGRVPAKVRRAHDDAMRRG
jgi:Lsr2